MKVKKVIDEKTRDEHFRQILAECKAKEEKESQDYMANHGYSIPAIWLTGYAKEMFKWYGLRGWKISFSRYGSSINGNCYLKIKSL